MQASAKAYGLRGPAAAASIVRRVHLTAVMASNFHLTRRMSLALLLTPSMRPATLACQSVASPAAWIESNLDQGPVVRQRSVSNSGWASASVYETKACGKYFVKVSRGKDDTMFKGEALGLTALWDTHTLLVPKVYAHGVSDGPGSTGSFIIMDYLELGGRLDQRELGRQLAMMHLATPQDPTAASGKFGFPVNNTIGGTPQDNTWTDNWVDFYRARRLKPQLDMAGSPQLSRLGEKLMDRLDILFEGITVKPSVLHGDLWSGNIDSVGDRPAIYDPATYYGHHEAEFGMSWCAGFSRDFWAGYCEVLPADPGFEERLQLYSLYHYLNHYNMFGESYFHNCTNILNRLVDRL